MSALSIQVPFPVFQDRDGQPLDNGYVWIGESNLNPQTNPVVAYYDSALTIVAAQPLRTINGYISRAGSPAQVYVDAANFSILVQDSKGSMVYNFPDGTGISPDASGVAYDPPFTGGVPTTVEDKLAQVVSLKDFGAVGDYTTDDTAAVVAWLAALAASDGKSGYVPTGVYRCTNNIVLPDRVKIYGAGATAIAAYPQIGGDKSLLRPGYKSQISGATFIFEGVPTNTFNTQRSDKFATNKPCFIYNGQNGFEMHNISVIQNMDVLTAAGALTTNANDNRAVNYTAGLMLNCTLALLNNVTIFGYFANAGLIIANIPSDGIVDPDYNRVTNCLITGGTAIIGDDTVAQNEGNTGQLFVGTGLYGPDHHTRVDTDPNIPCLYIDGYLVGIGQIRGHTFSACNFRTRNDTSVSLNRCQDVQIIACVWEARDIIGTSNTQEVRLIGIAGSTTRPNLALLASTVGQVQFIGANGVNDGAWFGQNGKFVGIYGDRNTGDSIIQLTDDISTTTSKWTIRRDESPDDKLAIRYDNVEVGAFLNDGSFDVGRIILKNSTLTIASGAVAVGGLSSYSIRTEGSAAADDLDTINGGVSGQLLYLRSFSTSEDVTVTEVGNIRLNSAGNFVLSNPQDRLVLQYDGTNWCEVSRSDNSV
jgi:hypothetical protein